MNATYDDWFRTKLDELGPWEWNETGIDIILKDHHQSRDVRINLLVDFFASIDAPMLKKGNVIKLYEAGYQTIEDIITCPVLELIRILGKNGHKVYDGLHDKALNNIPVWKLMGATNFFGRGIGERKIKKLIKALGYKDLCYAPAREIAKVDGFDEKTAEPIARGMVDYLIWVEPLEKDGFITIKTDIDVSAGSLKDQKVVFTGFRDKDLQKQAEDAGATMQSAVSGKTTLVVTPDPTANTGKLKKANDLGIKIISVDQFENML